MLLLVGLFAMVLGLAGLAFAILRQVSAAPGARLRRLASAALAIGGLVLTAVAWHDQPDGAALSSLPEAPDSGGRQLRSDRAAAAAWREVRWAPARVRFDVPAEWVERRNDATQLNLGPRDLQTTFVTMRLSRAPKLGAGDFLRAARVQGASRLAASRIAGYSVKTLGAASGVLSFERSKEDTKEQLSWTGLVPGSDQMITIWLGAAANGFARVEPVLGAVLESIRFE